MEDRKTLSPTELGKVTEQLMDLASRYEEAKANAGEAAERKADKEKRE